jgi:PAS domain S-box-containing protein
MDAREKIETVFGEIRSSLSEFRTIINTIPAIAWSSRPDCSVDFVNNRWEEYTGLSSEQSYGEGWQAAIHPEDLPGLLKNWERSRAIVTDTGEVRLRRFDGCSDGFHSAENLYSTKTGWRLDAKHLCMH